MAPRGRARPRGLSSGSMQRLPVRGGRRSWPGVPRLPDDHRGTRRTEARRSIEDRVHVAATLSGGDGRRDRLTRWRGSGRGAGGRRGRTTNGAGGWISAARPTSARSRPPGDRAPRRRQRLSTRQYAAERGRPRPARGRDVWLASEPAAVCARWASGDTVARAGGALNTRSSRGARLPTRREIEPCRASSRSSTSRS